MAGPADRDELPSLLAVSSPPGRVLLDSASHERADAARNRRKILQAASTVIRDRGIEALTMEQVAQVAGVGVGTVYRRFGDLAGLAYALLDERERELQHAFLYGAPPLGPGAPPVERLRAFLHALLDRALEQLDVLLVAETVHPTGRYDVATYLVYRTHVTALLQAGGVDSPHPGVLADCLLAPLSASLIAHQRRSLAIDRAKLAAGLDHLVGAVLHTPASHQR